MIASSFQNSSRLLVIILAIIFLHSKYFSSIKNLKIFFDSLPNIQMDYRTFSIQLTLFLSIHIIYLNS